MNGDGKADLIAQSTPTAYGHGAITLAVPSTRSAAVSWSDVYTVNCGSGEAVCDLSRGPTIVLAEATVTSAGTANADGSLTPLVKDTLVYVLLWTDMPCQPVGPAPSPGSTAAPRPEVTLYIDRPDRRQYGRGSLLRAGSGHLAPHCDICCLDGIGRRE